MVLDKPGQGISDVTKDTLAFAIRLPNTLIDYTGTDPNWIGKKVGQDPDNDWTQKIINVDELEYITGYDFLSNIPSEIQKVIEERKVGDIKAKLNAIVTEPAPLMTATNDELSSFSIPILRPNYNSPIGHGSSPNQISTTTNKLFWNSSVLEVGISQNGIFKSIDLSPTKESTTSIHLLQVASSEIGFMQTRPMQINGLQISIPNNSTFQSSLDQESTRQIGSSQIGFSKVSELQVSSTQVDFSQIKPSEFNRISSDLVFSLNQLNSSEISFPISIPKPQFVGSHFYPHNSTSYLVFNLTSSATNIWKNLSIFKSLLNINFQITNLATGQLTEAIITKYDSFGHPIGGTIFIDDDANGIGWFIVCDRL